MKLPDTSTLTIGPVITSDGTVYVVDDGETMYGMSALDGTITQVRLVASATACYASQFERSSTT